MTFGKMACKGAVVLRVSDQCFLEIGIITGLWREIETSVILAMVQLTKKPDFAANWDGIILSFKH